ncbi:MAG TPA: nitroreductase [Leeuwenhoekiella sp.]|nr:nitroreductase [Leeuwenhoekiella sp.]
MIEKETPTAYPIHPLLSGRWSPRAFDEKPVKEEEIRTILEAGRWAPSSNNLQPWRIIYGVKGSETYDRIMGCLVEFNQSWVKNAPVLMLGCYKKTNPKGQENFHALHDLGLFMANASLQAHDMGIGTHQMAGINFEKAKKEFGFPEEYHVATAVAMGYYGGDPEGQLSKELHAQELKKRERNPQSEFVFNGDFKK